MEKSNMKISLIVSTINRVEPLYKLLDSLLEQTYKNFEVIIIDQNVDEKVENIFYEYKNAKLNIIYTRSATGLSKGRNIGLGIATGDIIAFPDDDCWYFPTTLEKVVDIFNSDNKIFGVTGRCIDEFGVESVAKFPKLETTINKINVFSCAVSVTLFVKKNNIFFNERLGAGSGTIYGSGEESDYVLRIIETGKRMQYSPYLIIGHPNVMSTPTCQRALSYGYGMGYLLRNHHYPPFIVLSWFIKPLVGSLLMLFRLSPQKSLFFLNTAIGRIHGYIISTR